MQVIFIYGKGGWGMSCIYWYKYRKVTFSFPVLRLSFLCFFIQGIVRTLRQSDAQLFAGWGSHPSIGDAAMLEKIDRLANKAAALLKVLL